jgi:indole-3-glycerol phosphate synthase
MSTGAPTVLQRILRETREEVAGRKAQAPLPLSPRVESERRGSFREALARPGIGVIAEFKRRSPSAGTLHGSPRLPEIVQAYERGGAVAVSVLTEGPNFGGSLEDLLTARGACGLPLLRKDFIVDPYQLHEASAAGADAVLLIVAALTPAELAALHGEAADLGLDVLVEVHDSGELAVALELGAQIIGINNRDLRDFSVDVQRTEQLMEEIPGGMLVVSESGISDAAQLRRLAERGVEAVLVGETLMRSEDPEAALRRLSGLSSGDEAL